MRKTTEKLFNDIYESAKLSGWALIVTVVAFLVDSSTMYPTNKALLEFSVMMLIVITGGMALAMEASPNVLAMLLKKKEKTAMDYLMMAASAGIFLMVSGLNLIVKLGSMDLMYSDTNKGSYIQTAAGGAAETFKATDGQIAMTIIQALVPVMTSILVFIIGISQDTARLEQKKRLVFLKAAREDLGTMEGKIAALEQEPEADIISDMVRSYFEEEYRVLDAVCGQLKRDAAHLIASRVGRKEEAFSYLQNRRKGHDSGNDIGPGPERQEDPNASGADMPDDVYEEGRKESFDSEAPVFEAENMEDIWKESREADEESDEADSREKVSGERYPGSGKVRPFRPSGERYPV